MQEAVLGTVLGAPQEDQGACQPVMQGLNANVAEAQRKVHGQFVACGAASSKSPHPEGAPGVAALSPP